MQLGVATMLCACVDHPVQSFVDLLPVLAQTVRGFPQKPQANAERVP